MIQRRDDIPGIDDFIAETTLTRRARLRQLADCSTPGGTASARCGRHFMHPRRPADIDALSAVIDTCACLRASGHDQGCLCAHGFERLVYRVDGDGRERYVTLPLR
jgi:hypothetical protein